MSQQQHAIRRQARHFHDHFNARSDEGGLPRGASDIFWLLGISPRAQPCLEEKPLSAISRSTRTALAARLCVRRSNHDISRISLQEAAAQGPWPRDGVCGGGKRRSDRIPARQPDVVVSL